MRVFTSFVKSSMSADVDGSLDSCLVAFRLYAHVFDISYRDFEGVIPSVTVAEVEERFAAFLFVKGAQLPQDVLDHITPAEMQALMQLKSFLGHVLKMREKGASQLFLANLNTGVSASLSNSFRGGYSGSGS